MASPELLELSQEDRETLETWLVEFDQTWQEDALATWAAEKLPGPETTLRRLALAEMVRVDLERQWQRDHRLLLESYLKRFPELGDAETVSVGLILAEYDVRQQFGKPADLNKFAGRFPRQASELAELVERMEAERSAPPLPLEQTAAAERDTSRPGVASDTTQPFPLTPKELPETFGRYRTFKKLGQGGMGAVYLVFDTQLERQVALKVPRFSDRDGPEAVERFLREARAAATIEHPNVCPIHDVGEIDGIHYMTMTYIEGDLLSEAIQPGKPTLVPQAVTLVRKLALALQEAHDRGIVHRDLKPSNIIINQRGEPVIMDFGLARRVESDDAPLTQTGAVLGTPAYMSPEQARRRGQEIGPQSDLYSLGVILYELLTGRRPFRGEMIEVLSQILTDEPEPPSTHCPSLAPALETICLKAMAKRPEDRYASMMDLATAIDEYLQLDKEAPVPPEAEPSVGRGSPDPALANDPAVSSAPGEPPVSDAAPSEDRPQHEEPDEETYGLSKALRGLTGLVPDMDENELLQEEGQSEGVVPDDETQGEPKPQPESDTRRRVPRWAWIATGMAAAVVLLGVILYVATNYGHVKIELSDPSAQVDLKLDGTIEIANLGHPLRIRAGEHFIDVTGDNFETRCQNFSIKRGKEELVWISLVPKSTVGPAKKPHPGIKPASDKPPLAVAPFDAEKAKQHQEAWAKHLGVPVEITNSIGMKLVLIPLGEFLMGSSETEPSAKPAEEPQHRVRITRPFYVGMHEVMQEEYERITGKNPSGFSRDGEHKLADVNTSRFPVEKVSCVNAIEFCQKLSSLPEEKAAGRAYRLPTEAEWEYACRAGTTTPFHFGMELNESSANYETNRTVPVGSYPPNAFRLHDMHGNVGEWCQDWYQSDYYKYSPTDDPKGPPAAKERVYRGGSCGSDATNARSASRTRYFEPMGGISSYRGFRVVMQVSNTDSSTSVASPDNGQVVAPEDTTTASKMENLTNETPATRPTYIVEKGRGSPLLAMGVTPDGQRLLTGYANGVVAEWDLNTGRRLRRRVWEGAFDSSHPEYMAFSVDAQKVAIGYNAGSDWEIQVYDVASWEKLDGRGAGGSIVSLGFGPDNSTFFGSGSVMTIIWNTNSSFQELVYGLGRALLPDSRRVLVTKDNSVAMIAPGTGSAPQVFQGSGLGRLALSTKGDMMVTQSQESGKGILWHVPTGRQVQLDIPSFSCATFSPDGRQVLIAPSTKPDSNDLSLWDLAAKRETVRLTGHIAKVHAMVFTPDGRHAITGSKNGTVRIWELATGKELVCLYDVDSGKDWLAVTPEGYHAGSAGGCNLLFWTKDDEILPREPCEKTFHRPDLVARAIRGVTPEIEPTGPVERPPAEDHSEEASQERPHDAPALAVAPFEAEQAKRHQRAWAEYLGVPVEIANSIGMKLVLIPPGEFEMGSLEANCSDEGPLHNVKIVEPYYMSAFEVTQLQYKNVMRVNRARFSLEGGGRHELGDTDELPAENVSRTDAIDFCRKLAARSEEKVAGREYRLPTEAQWEYACRAGTTTAFHFGPSLNGGEANCSGTQPYGTGVRGPSLGRPTAVGSYSSNPFRLYDMHGNVWEWCEDRHTRYYNEKLPAGAPIREVWVRRGGSWLDAAHLCRAAKRGSAPPSFRSGDGGFRVVMVVSEAPNTGEPSTSEPEETNKTDTDD